MNQKFRLQKEHLHPPDQENKMSKNLECPICLSVITLGKDSCEATECNRCETGYCKGCV